MGRDKFISFSEPITATFRDDKFLSEFSCMENLKPDRRVRHEILQKLFTENF